MGHLIDLEAASPRFVPRPNRPGPVRELKAVVARRRLVLRWKRPLGSGPVTHYRVESPPDGKQYELLGKTATEDFCVREVPLRLARFYRVLAVNASGAGRQTLVWFLQRRGRLTDILMPVATRRGRRVNICVME